MIPSISHLPFLSMPVGAALTEHPGMSANLTYQLTGLLVVLSALAFLALAIKLAGWMFTAVEKARAREQSAGVAAPVSAHPVHHGTPPEVVAVIAAAVDAVLEGRGRILSIHESGHAHSVHADGKLLAWSMEGRRQIFSSHQPR